MYLARMNVIFGPNVYIYRKEIWLDLYAIYELQTQLNKSYAARQFTENILQSRMLRFMVGTS